MELGLQSMSRNQPGRKSEVHCGRRQGGRPEARVARSQGQDLGHVAGKPRATLPSPGLSACVSVCPQAGRTGASRATCGPWVWCSSPCSTASSPSTTASRRSSSARSRLPSTPSPSESSHPRPGRGVQPHSLEGWNQHSEAWSPGSKAQCQPEPLTTPLSYIRDGRVSENTVCLIRKLLVLDPQQRLAAADVLEALSAIIASW